MDCPIRIPESVSTTWVPGAMSGPWGYPTFRYLGTPGYAAFAIIDRTKTITSTLQQTIANLHRCMEARKEQQSFTPRLTPSRLFQVEQLSEVRTISVWCGGWSEHLDLITSRTSHALLGLMPVKVTQWRYCIAVSHRSDRTFIQDSASVASHRHLPRSA